MRFEYHRGHTACRRVCAVRCCEFLSSMAHAEIVGGGNGSDAARLFSKGIITSHVCDPVHASHRRRGRQIAGKDEPHMYVCPERTRRRHRGKSKTGPIETVHTAASLTRVLARQANKHRKTARASQCSPRHNAHCGPPFVRFFFAQSQLLIDRLMAKPPPETRVKSTAPPCRNVATRTNMPPRTPTRTESQEVKKSPF